MAVQKRGYFIAFFLLSFVAAACIIFGSAAGVVYDNSFFENEFRKYGVQENLAKYNALEVHTAVMGFLLGRKDAPQNFFTQRELEHLSDVKTLFTFGKIILFISLVFIALYLGFILFIIKKSKQRKWLRKFLVAISWACCVLMVGIGLFALSLRFNFAGSFELFHRLFFSGGTYVFNPAIEKIVVLYPEGIFYDAGFIIARNIFAVSAAVFLSCFGVLKYSVLSSNMVITKK